MGGGFWCAGLEEREGDPCAVLEVVGEVQGAELKVMEGIRETSWKKNGGDFGELGNYGWRGSHEPSGR